MVGERHSQTALKYFAKLSDREHAIFEAGIALGAIFHQLIGLPINVEKIEELEKTLNDAFLNQPFRRIVDIKIKREYVKRGFEKPYSYGVISPESLEAKIVVEYGEAKVVAKLRWIDELRYPLMFIEEIF
ncbi:MAG: dihydroneopterin aldolase family protein [Nitrososphaeria archaeon]|nr:dihydroneopterin aldolase family protein [Nitrososphaeria archaeon]MDW7986449.1 dihydroneopterin aldolase family protein [Nitrososphaerota archaeon]